MRQTPSSRIRVGVAGWYYPDWQGIVYPEGMQGTDHLRYLAGFVDAIEINSTFYRPPEPGDVARWCSRVSDLTDFRFTLKLWQRFTHAREQWSPAELTDFLARVRPLFQQGRGGAMLAQFPHSFHFTKENASYLDGLLDRIAGIPVVVEVRHYSWGNPDALALVRGLGAGICSIDQPMFRGSLAPLETTTGKVAYVRLHGRNRKAWFSANADRDMRYDYLYSPEELTPWVERTLRLSDQAREVYVITNNHFRGQEVCNALMLKSMLVKRRIPAPAGLLERFPVLGDYVVPDSPVQGTLFG